MRGGFALTVAGIHVQVSAGTGRAHLLPDIGGIDRTLAPGKPGVRSAKDIRDGWHACAIDCFDLTGRSGHFVYGFRHIFTGNCFLRRVHAELFLQK